MKYKFGGSETAAVGGGKKSCLKMVLKPPQGHEDSEYVLSFKIGQREGGFYSG